MRSSLSSAASLLVDKPRYDKVGGRSDQGQSTCDHAKEAECLSTWHDVLIPGGLGGVCLR